MEFKKEDTNIAKGIAICLMFLNHLYAFPDRVLNGNYYIPLIPFFDAERQIGNFGSICVSIFIFLSGYGMFQSCSRSEKPVLKYTLRKVIDFYFTYWIYFLIFVPIGIVFFHNVTLWHSDQIRYSADLPIFLENFLGWSARYNGEWWFVRMYTLILLIIFPTYINLLKRSSIFLFSISICIFLISYALKVDYSGTYGFLFWQMIFAIGLLCARLDFFSSRFVRYLDAISEVWLFLSLLLCFILRVRFGAKIDFLLVPILIHNSLRVINILRLSRILSFIGVYSFQMWLIHSFFCYYYFQNFIYLPKWSPLIFILLTVTSLSTVILIEHLRIHIQKIHSIS